MNSLGFLIGLAIGLPTGYILKSSLSKHDCIFSEPIKIREGGRWHYFLRCPQCDTLDEIEDSELWKVDLGTFKEVGL